MKSIKYLAQNLECSRDSLNGSGDDGGNDDEEDDDGNMIPVYALMGRAVELKSGADFFL